MRVSVPYGVPEFAAKQFVKSKIDWINQHSKQPNILKDGDRIGKHHTLQLQREPVDSIKTRVSSNQIIVTLPQKANEKSTEVQRKVIQSCERALKKQGENLLPQRVAHIAETYNHSYKDVSVKKLKSRWGACSNRGELSFTIFLMQLDWQLIDYVIKHELAHTKHQHHQSSFWDEVERMCPDYKSLRKSLKSHPVAVKASSL